MRKNYHINFNDFLIYVRYEYKFNFKISKSIISLKILDKIIEKYKMLELLINLVYEVLSDVSVLAPRLFILSMAYKLLINSHKLTLSVIILGLSSSLLS